jgi:glutathione S-transferase
MPHAPNSSPVYCRAEIIRIILNYGGIPFEDFTFKFEAWPEYKPKMPFGQVPVLEASPFSIFETFFFKYFPNCHEVRAS